MSEVQEVDTSLAMEVTAMAEQFGTVVPSNISPGLFIQFSADNNDLKEETLDGTEKYHTRNNHGRLSAKAIWPRTPTHGTS